MCHHISNAVYRAQYPTKCLAVCLVCLSDKDICTTHCHLVDELRASRQPLAVNICTAVADEHCTVSIHLLPWYYTCSIHVQELVVNFCRCDPLPTQQSNHASHFTFRCVCCWLVASQHVTAIRHAYSSRSWPYMPAICWGPRGGVVDWGTGLQIGRSRVQFPMGLLTFPAARWLWNRLSL